MTEILLNALLNLFAVQAALLGENGHEKLRHVVHRYLRDHLRLSNVSEYMGLFDLLLEMHAGSGEDILLPQARDIVRQLRSNLPLNEQHVFVLRLLESVAGLDPDLPARKLIALVAGELLSGPAQVTAMSRLCLFSEAPERGSARELLGEGISYLEIRRPDFDGAVAALRLEDAGMTLVASAPGTSLTLDSKPLFPGSPQVLPPGAILRDARGNRIYQSEISAALKDTGRETHLTFDGLDLNFRYPESDNGLHDFSFSLNGGTLVGVMGVSGAGKSTLLNILNGQQKPDSGHLLVNGIDLHHESQQLEGVIGYVPQDDLLFEELTVFDNLFYNASLCMTHLDKTERKKRVEALLDELNQLSIRDLRVGSPLNKTISGGQRKRLNIALELLREPPILFVDEPTSGLSSADSENVMALLKAQAGKGKLVVVVIHQPSSLIYKMFDRLWIMDVGGRPIYDGNPLDAIVHFRSEIFRTGMDEYSCPRCGHVNPEQLFEIIESRTIDDQGRYSRDRRVSPEQWHQRYLEQQDKHPARSAESHAAPVERRLQRPGWFGQLGVFFMRTFKGRISNGQYLLVNLLEPPVLALLAALICHGAWGAEYSLMNNGNLATYFFISVIIALFLGLSVSAEEINRDRKILQREQFLNLSWSSYVTSKTLYLFAVAALQMTLFVLVGNTVLQIPNMTGATLTVLFSLAAASAVLGLNISSAFRSAVTIYILIPLLLVPQMMLGGAVIPFDDLLPRNAGHRRTPLVADMMPSRWGYEALVVRQYLSNEYMRHFLPSTLDKLQYDYLTGSHIPEMRALADYPLIENNSLDKARESSRRLAALTNELQYIKHLSGLDPAVPDQALNLSTYESKTRSTVKQALRQMEQEFARRRNHAFDLVRAKEDRLRNELGRDGLKALKSHHFNKEIANLVTNALSFETVRLSGERLVQVATPISRPPESSLGGAQFLSAHKRLGPFTVSTCTYNLAVIWTMVLLLFLALQARLLSRFFRLAGRLRRKI